MLRQVYQQTTGTMNPSYLTGLLAGGAGGSTAGTTPNPGISAPYLEDYLLEVFDVTAPTTLTAVAGAVTAGTPAIAGKLLVVDPANSGPGGWLWKLNSAKSQACPEGTFGIVYKPANPKNVGPGVATANGNIASPGDRALVVTNGPVQAFVATTVNTTAISAGMALSADGAGNLTYAGASPSVGTVLAMAMDSMSGSISTPALKNVYVGGY